MFWFEDDVPASVFCRDIRDIIYGILYYRERVEKYIPYIEFCAAQLLPLTDETIASSLLFLICFIKIYLVNRSNVCGPSVATRDTLVLTWLYLRARAL